ncbi:MAG: lysine--tRNA ligase [bacterium]|nr:lysine--tRNA ligase [bacterium]
MSLGPQSEEEVRIDRRKLFLDKGINPYPARTARTHDIEHVVSNFDHLAEGGASLTIAGRVFAIRGHGKSAFLVVRDGTGSMQVYCTLDGVGAEQYELFKNTLDLGDFIEVAGTPFRTKTGEPTIRAEHWKILTKTLLPLPEKFHGLEDTELRLRKRYLDLLANPEVREVFAKRERIIFAIRNFHRERGFFEAETPLLHPIAGGANARPFVTHHNALDMDLYLRIALELYLKRLIVGGFDKVFEIGTCFRNEGIDWAHNPEFTMLESYWSYHDYHDLMTFIEELMQHLVSVVFGSADAPVNFSEHAISFTPPYQRLDYREALIERSGIDIDAFPDDAALRAAVLNKGVEIDATDGRGTVIDKLYKKFVRPNLIQPTFIINHPKVTAPLAKTLFDRPDYIERVQLVVCGMEITNGFSELNDPVEQYERFLEQERARLGGDEEANPMDEDFVTALKHGMPPCVGNGIGIDRLVALLTNQHHIRDVIMFPTLRPKT